MVEFSGTRLLAAADALTILEQIEGALAYFNTIGTRAETMALQADADGHGICPPQFTQPDAPAGYFHNHSAVTDHPEHHVVSFTNTMSKNFIHKG